MKIIKAKILREVKFAKYVKGMKLTMLICTLLICIAAYCMFFKNDYIIGAIFVITAGTLHTIILSLDIPGTTKAFDELVVEYPCED